MEKDIFAQARAILLQSGNCTLHLKVRAGAQRTAVRGILEDGTIKIDIAAVREDGKANAALVTFLADRFSVSRACIRILTGHTSSKKTIHIQRL